MRFSSARRDATDFLGVSFSATDTVGHPFGPASRELEDTVARQDDVLGALIKHLDAKVGRERYVLALSADHGVADVPVTRGAGRVAQEDVRERIEEILVTRFGPAPDNTRYVVAATDFIRFADGVFDRDRADAGLMAAIERGRDRHPRRRAGAETRPALGTIVRSDRSRRGVDELRRPQRRSDHRRQAELAAGRPRGGGGRIARRAAATTTSACR